MEMLIIGAGAALGYALNNKRKQLSQSVKVSDYDQPSGPLIYEQDRLQKVQDDEQRLAAKKYPTYVQRLFPQDYNKPNSVIGNDVFSTDIGAPIDFPMANNVQQIQYSQNVQQAITADGRYAAINPQNGQQVNPIFSVTNSPMFQNQQLLFSEPGKPEIKGPVSLLSAQPLDMTHGNMQPFFSGKSQQQSLQNENPYVLLERYTGVPSVIDQGTYSIKKEVPLAYPNNPENPIHPNISQLGDRYGRAVSAVRPPTNEFINPFKQEIEIPFNSNIRVNVPDIDQLRSKNHQKYQYDGVTTGGQKGSTRGMIPTLKDNTNSLFKEVNPERYFPRSQTTAKDLTPVPGVRNNIHTAEVSHSYQGHAGQSWANNMSQLSHNYDNAVNRDNVRKGIETFQPQIGAASSLTSKYSPQGGYILREQEKGKTTPNLSGAYSKGMRQEDVHAPDFTLKDATQINHAASNINPSGKFLKDGAYKHISDNFTVDVTSKDLLVNNTYVGLPHQDHGRGFTQNGMEQFSTAKESLLFDGTNGGTVRSNVSYHMSYDSVFETGKETTKNLEQLGLSKGSGISGITKKQLYNSEYSNDYQSIQVDSKGNPTAPTTLPIDRNQFNAGITQQHERLTAENHYNPGMASGGEDGKRLENYRHKDDATVDGIVNPGLRRDGKNQHLEIEAEFKDDQDKVDIMSHTLHSTAALGLARNEPMTRTTDFSVENSRLDTGLIISNDLYPWLRGGEKRGEI
jgi:hypothetical protein